MIKRDPSLCGRNIGGIVVKKPSAWLEGQRLAHPDQDELQNLVIGPENDHETTYFEFLEGLTSALACARGKEGG